MSGRVARDSSVDLAVELGVSHGSVVESLACAVEAKDPETGSHLYRSAMLAKACLALIDPELARSEEITFGFVLHDVGKIGIPDHILTKPAPLTDAEWEIMRTHPELGMDIVRPLGFGPKTTDVIIAHHERWNGSGYPYGLRGENIPLSARVFAVADCYDAVTSERAYRPAASREVTKRWLLSEAGEGFDPTVVRAFLELID